MHLHNRYFSPLGLLAVRHCSTGKTLQRSVPERAPINSRMRESDSTTTLFYHYHLASSRLYSRSSFIKILRQNPCPCAFARWQNPCPCAFTGILIRKVNYLPSINSARYTQRIILLQTVKLGWSALFSADCSRFRPSVRTALCCPPIRQQSATPSAELPMADADGR